jgi:hypothetical protein
VGDCNLDPSEKPRIGDQSKTALRMIGNIHRRTAVVGMFPSPQQITMHLRNCLFKLLDVNAINHTNLKTEYREDRLKRQKPLLPHWLMLETNHARGQSAGVQMF